MKMKNPENINKKTYLKYLILIKIEELDFDIEKLENEKNNFIVPYIQF